MEVPFKKIWYKFYVWTGNGGAPNYYSYTPTRQAWSKIAGRLMWLGEIHDGLR